MNPPGQSTKAKCPLTPRQLEFLTSATLGGQTYSQIAFNADRTVSTVRSTLSAVYERLGVLNASQALVACLINGWIVVPGTPALQTDEQTRVRFIGPALDKIEDTLEEVAGAIEARDPHPVTDSQYAYLEAFDAWIRIDGSDPEWEERGEHMTERLGVVMHQGRTDGRAKHDKWPPDKSK